MSSFPIQISKNQFGEQSNSYLIGGSPLICSFVVDAANANGLGLKALSGAGIKQIFMNTSQTPATGSPNPAAGLIMIQLASAYSAYQFSACELGSPVSGTPINVTTGVTKGSAYVIQTLGTTPIAQWQVLGLPVGQIPAVGAAFIAIATTTATGTGTIEVQKATGSGIGSMEVIGDPSATALSSDASGAWIIGQFLAATNSSTTTLHAAAPADGTLVKLSFTMAQAPGSIL